MIFISELLVHEENTNYNDAWTIEILFKLKNVNQFCRNFRIWIQKKKNHFVITVKPSKLNWLKKHRAELSVSLRRLKINKVE